MIVRVVDNTQEINLKRLQPEFETIKRHFFAKEKTNAQAIEKQALVNQDEILKTS